LNAVQHYPAELVLVARGRDQAEPGSLDLVNRFHCMLRARTPDALSAWVTGATASSSRLSVPTLPMTKPRFAPH
jgi:hypothetical protein